MKQLPILFGLPADSHAVGSKDNLGHFHKRIRIASFFEIESTKRGYTWHKDLKRDRREEFVRLMLYEHSVAVRIQHGIVQLQYSPFQTLRSLQVFQDTTKDLWQSWPCNDIFPF